MHIMNAITIGVSLVIFGVIMALIGSNVDCSASKNVSNCNELSNIMVYLGFGLSVSGLAFTAIMIKITPADPKEPATKGEKCLS